jgi:hypothetical protein
MTSRYLVLLFAAGLLLSCFNRAGARFHGASGTFHPAQTGYVSRDVSPRSIRVSLPTDDRPAHYGERVAGTSWEACSTDPMGSAAPAAIAGELERELRDSQIFREVVAAPDGSALVLDTEIRAFCSQAIGFLYLRVAGITSLRFTLRDGERILLERTIERVVTDVDDEYTGSQVSTIEQAMKILMSDSLREVLQELLPALDELEPGEA